MIERQSAGFEPTTGSTPETQLSDCLSGLEDRLAADGIDRGRVLRQTCFLRAGQSSGITELKAELEPLFREFYAPSTPPTAYVGQPPAGGARVALEVWLAGDAPGSIRIREKTAGEIRYRTADTAFGREIIAAGLAGSTAKDTRSRAESAFGLMRGILEREGASFSQVVRQWNYIEDIVGGRSAEDTRRQNYQIFNDERTRAYARDRFPEGYPAATGIGMNRGGIIIDFQAFQPGETDLRIIPLSNPRQIDAHRYTQDVLAGAPPGGSAEKGTPKFERAKLIAAGNRGLIFISGTAAIVGQLTTAQAEAADQTRTTLENIERLISAENLSRHDFPADRPGRIEYMRVYVKHERDFPRVQEACRTRLPDVPALYVVSDVCRPELRVEIEGIARISE